MIFYDFEVFKHDFLAVFIDTDTRQVFPIANDRNDFREMYEKNRKNIWVGFNNNHYDQYIFKAILLGMDPYEVSNRIIVEGLDGWQISREFSKIHMINYDVFSSKSHGLKTLEGFMGNNIKESSVPFNIDRKLTEDELWEVIEYCTSDVMNTMEVFMETVDTFNAFTGIIEAFPDQLTLNNLGDTSAQLTANVLGCDRHDWDDEFDFFFLPCIQLNKYKEVQDWFADFIGKKFASTYERDQFYKSTSLTVDVAGVPHKFGFGGCHGAPVEPLHAQGGLYHVDANNYLFF